jgi:hypothetical protein
MRRILRPHSVALMALAVYLTGAVPAGAQSVEGWVVDDESSETMGAVEVVVLAPNDSIVRTYVTDDDGKFVVLMPDEGSYRLRAMRIGYEPSVSDVFMLLPGQAAMAELRLQVDPVLLDPLVAIVESQSIALARVGFYEREEIGFGDVRTALYFAEKPPLDVSDLFQGMNGIQVRRATGAYDYDVWSTRRRGCRPSISIDGAVVQDGIIDTGSSNSLLVDNDESRSALGSLPELVGDTDLVKSAWQTLVNPHEVAAIEVYPGQAGMPPWVGGLRSPCGAVIIWTKGFVMRAEAVGP